MRLIKKDTLVKIADAIKSKTGVNDLIPPENMPDEIYGITTGCSFSKCVLVKPLHIIEKTLISNSFVPVVPLAIKETSLINDDLTIEKEE